MRKLVLDLNNSFADVSARPANTAGEVEAGVANSLSADRASSGEKSDSGGSSNDNDRAA